MRAIRQRLVIGDCDLIGGDPVGDVLRSNRGAADNRGVIEQLYHITGHQLLAGEIHRHCGLGAVGNVVVVGGSAVASGHQIRGDGSKRIWSIRGALDLEREFLGGEFGVVVTVDQLDGDLVSDLCIGGQSLGVGIVVVKNEGDRLINRIQAELAVAVGADLSPDDCWLIAIKNIRPVRGVERRCRAIRISNEKLSERLVGANRPVGNPALFLEIIVGNSSNDRKIVRTCDREGGIDRRCRR